MNGDPRERPPAPSSLRRGEPAWSAARRFHLPLSLGEYPSCAAAFSETVLVTDSGHEVLTRFDRELVR